MTMYDHPHSDSQVKITKDPRGYTDKNHVTLDSNGTYRRIDFAPDESKFPGKSEYPSVNPGGEAVPRCL